LRKHTNITQTFDSKPELAWQINRFINLHIITFIGTLIAAKSPKGLNCCLTARTRFSKHAVIKISSSYTPSSPLRVNWAASAKLVPTHSNFQPQQASRVVIAAPPPVYPSTLIASVLLRYDVDGVGLKQDA